MGRNADHANVVRVAAVADLHCARAMAAGTFQPLFTQVAEQADVLALAGDLTDYGLPEEARLLVRELAAAKVPVVAVFGNHDYESERPEEVKQILADAGVTVLDGDSCEVLGVGFAGVKGFGGGFGERALQSWGEPILKQFVREAVEEALKLESALARLRTSQRIALMHYSPIRSTVESEAPEITPFLGSSRLEDPLNRYPVFAVFHGHAHRGTPEGRTAGGVRVYNVALPLLRRRWPERPPFRVIDVPVQPAADNAATPISVNSGAGFGATVP
jgi:Icc-related predicted phosphoesterase